MEPRANFSNSWYQEEEQVRHWYQRAVPKRQPWYQKQPPQMQQPWQNSEAAVEQEYGLADDSIQYQKRQLPQLQRYNNSTPLGNRYPYWNDREEYTQPPKSKYRFSFAATWQKIVITFTSILSLVCLSWVAYNWGHSKSNDPEIIEPDHASFKVLPDAANHANIPYQDKSVYSRVDPSLKLTDAENIIPQPDIPSDIPTYMPEDKACKQCQVPKAVEEYAILDEHDYYIKCATDKSLAGSQLAIIKKKLNSFPNPILLKDINCDIKKVINKSGTKDESILIGPFKSSDDAAIVAQHCSLKGKIITVKANKGG